MRVGRIVVFVLIHAFALSWAFASVAADEDGSSDRIGPYVGIRVAGGLPLFDGEEIVLAPARFDRKAETTVGIGARMGWRLHPLLSIEAQYEWMSNFRVRVRETTCADIEAHALTANARIFLPFESVHLYAMAGAGATQWDVNIHEATFSSGNGCSASPDLRNRGESWEFTARYGTGMDVYLSRHVLINFEYSILVSDEEILDARIPYMSFGAGLQYRF